jgi:hypothetical protein
MAGTVQETVSVNTKKAVAQTEVWKELAAYIEKANAAGFVPSYISVHSKDRHGADQVFHYSSDGED